MSDAPPPDPLARLEQRLERARREQAEEHARRRPPALSGSALSIGVRIGIELVAALCVGLALGWVFDRVLGTRPWGLIVFFLLGSAAGMMNVFRMANQIGRGPASPGGATGRPAPDDEDQDD